MMTVLVQFPLPASIDRAQAVQQFRAAAPRFREPAGLLRKYFLLSEDGRTAGGVYLWRSRAEAQAYHGAEFRDGIARRYGTAPTVTMFESPVVVDNPSGEILTAD